MRKREITIWATVMAACFFLLAGCGGQAKPQPQAVNEAVDTCEECHMAVMNNGYAAQIAMADGQVKKFDDIGCEVKYEAAHKDLLAGAGIYVQDLNTKEWVEKEKATFVFLPEEATPMGYGVHSFKTKEAAEAFVKEHGKGEILDAAGLSSHDWHQDK